jgi:hypothetical protein
MEGTFPHKNSKNMSMKLCYFKYPYLKIFTDVSLICIYSWIIFVDTLNCFFFSILGVFYLVNLQMFSIV